jgi:ubiquinone/menaquinone biosynthesis C-methylase UbiE
MHPDADKAFVGDIPQIYDTYLVPMIFQPYAADMAARLSQAPPAAPARVLELACGTGVLTRALASALPASSAIVATDLNQAMLDRAAKVGTQRAVEWRVADAAALPFGDGTFDAVIRQIGAMFFDKIRCFAEVKRVLASDGVFRFSVWDRIEENEFEQTVTRAVAALYEEDPPLFLARTPHGYFDTAAIARDLAAGGFTAAPNIVTLTARSRASSPRIVAIAYCHGTPLRNEIEARNGATVNECTDAVEAAIARRFGQGPVDGKMQAHVISVKVD